MATIIDKLQVLALRRPRALIIVAQVLDGLLKRQLDALDDDFDGENMGVAERNHMVEGSANPKVDAHATRGCRARRR
jgi:hypothetical protein